MSARLRTAALHIASELPQGDPTRREILSALREASFGSEIRAVVKQHIPAWVKAMQAIQPKNRAYTPTGWRGLIDMFKGRTLGEVWNKLKWDLQEDLDDVFAKYEAPGGWEANQGDKDAMYDILIHELVKAKVIGPNVIIPRGQSSTDEYVTQLIRAVGEPPGAEDVDDRRAVIEFTRDYGKVVVKVYDWFDENKPISAYVSPGEETYENPLQAAKVVKGRLAELDRLDQQEMAEQTRSLMSTFRKALKAYEDVLREAPIESTGPAQYVHMNFDLEKDRRFWEAVQLIPGVTGSPSKDQGRFVIPMGRSSIDVSGHGPYQAYMGVHTPLTQRHYTWDKARLNQAAHAFVAVMRKSGWVSSARVRVQID